MAYTFACLGVGQIAQSARPFSPAMNALGQSRRFCDICDVSAIGLISDLPVRRCERQIGVIQAPEPEPRIVLAEDLQAGRSRLRFLLDAITWFRSPRRVHHNEPRQALLRGIEECGN